MLLFETRDIHIAHLRNNNHTCTPCKKTPLGLQRKKKRWPLVCSEFSANFGGESFVQFEHEYHEAQWQEAEQIQVWHFPGSSWVGDEFGPEGAARELSITAAKEIVIDKVL